MSADSPRRSSGNATRGVTAVPAIVPPQVVSDRSILDSAIGFINEVTLANQPPIDPKDTITWARINPNPAALGPRWLAYAENKLLHAKRSGSGCDGDGVASYTATVLNASKCLVKGLRELGEQVAAGLTGNSGSTSNSKNTSFDSSCGLDAKQGGVVTIIDIKVLVGQDHNVKVVVLIRYWKTAQCMCNFAKSRSWLLDPPNVTREAPHRMQRKAVDSLFIMAGHGALIQYDLDTNLPPTDNWLIQKRNSDILNDSFRQNDETDDRTESWLSQVEIITHAGPHRRLWMGPHSNLTHVDTEAVEIGITKSNSLTNPDKFEHSNPLNMPLTAAGRSSAVPVLIESGSYSSVEQSPKLMDRFRHDHLDSDYSVTHGDSRLTLADAMRESPSTAALSNNAVSAWKTLSGADMINQNLNKKNDSNFNKSASLAAENRKSSDKLLPEIPTPADLGNEKNLKEFSILKPLDPLPPLPDLEPLKLTTENAGSLSGDISLITFESPLMENTSLQRKITPSPRGFTEQNLIIALCGSLHFENEQIEKSDISPPIFSSNHSSSAFEETSVADYKSLTENDDPYISLEQSSQDTNTAATNNDKFFSSTNSSGSEEIIKMEEK
ncbi:Breast carcinoma-amplified sequence 3 homolog [Eumeta japonica]|uniref:Breast carcinoma-amplified sequence 3 homolog n=1 Tax=Eumeta variegata TaxID=151549 RepID=A0A4C1SRJ8_EUMVA|nr:Breast carcinoma-amplified sequence 3 homolog [Eumeta japonica]